MDASAATTVTYVCMYLGPLGQLVFFNIRSRYLGLPCVDVLQRCTHVDAALCVAVPCLVASSPSPSTSPSSYSSSSSSSS